MKSRTTVLTLGAAAFLVLLFLFAMTVPSMQSMVDDKVKEELPRVGNTLFLKEFPVGHFVPTRDWSVGNDSDSFLHLAISAEIGYAVNTAFHFIAPVGISVVRAAISGLIATLPGLGKEILDSFEPGNWFDWDDLRRDVIGAFYGSWMSEMKWIKLIISEKPSW